MNDGFGNIDPEKALQELLVNKGGADEVNPQDILAQMGININEKQMEMLNLVSQVDLGWLSQLLAVRPEWDISDCFFHTALYDVARMHVINLLQFEVTKSVFPQELLVYVKDTEPGSTMSHARIDLKEPLPHSEDMSGIKERIPYIVDINGKQLDKKMEPDALLLVRAHKGKKPPVDNFTPFNVSVVLLTYAFMGTAAIEVDPQEGPATNHQIFVRPSDELVDWDDIIPYRECKPK